MCNSSLTFSQILQFVRRSPACALIDGNVGCKRLADVNLSRTANASAFGLTDLAIICDPTRHTSYSKHHGEHFHGDPDGAHHNTTVEINIGIELSLNEIRVTQGLLLELQGYVQQRVTDLQRF